MERKQKPLQLAPPPKPTPRTVEIEYPPGVPIGDENVLGVRIHDNNDAGRGVRAGDLCVVWWQAAPSNGDFAAVKSATGNFYVGTFRHAPGGYVTLTQGEVTTTFKPGEHVKTGRVLHAERDGKVVERFGAGRDRGAR